MNLTDSTTAVVLQTSDGEITIRASDCPLFYAEEVREFCFRHFRFQYRLPSEIAESGPGPVDDDGNYEVSEISAVRFSESLGYEFLTHWEGWELPTWEPLANLDGSADLLREFMLANVDELNRLAGLTRSDDEMLASSSDHE